MKDVSLQINKALKSEMHEALSSAGAPACLVDKVDEFSTGLYPFVKNQGPTPRRGKGLNITPFVIDPPQETPDELSKQFQDFYAGLEADLLSTGRTGGSHTPEGEEEKEKSSKKGGKELSERAVREILEAVERVMCSLFYDRRVALALSDVRYLLARMRPGCTCSLKRMMPRTTKHCLVALLP